MNHQASALFNGAKCAATGLGGGLLGLSFASSTYTTSASSSGNVAMPTTLRQPKATASEGANNAANAVPEFPAPAMPSAVPWYCGGYQREASGKATANAEPAMPSTSPSINTWLKELMPTDQATSSPAMTSS